MAAKQQKGNCYLCGAELGKTAMKNHILRQHSAGEEKCLLLKVEGRDNKNYWLYLTIPLTAALNDLDVFLRHIWLECCGHMSAFFDSYGEEYRMTRRLRNFKPGEQFLYEYDFGDTTELLITAVEYVKRKPQQAPVRLLGRNLPIDFECGKCEKPAVFVDQEKLYSGEYPCLCADCAEKADADMLLPLVNSPRTGQCCYTGEQDDFGFDPEAVGEEEEG